MTKTKFSIKSYKPSSWVTTIVLVAVAAIFIFSVLYITLIIALKTPSQLSDVLAWPSEMSWQNFVDAWNMTNYPQKFLNTLAITIITLVFTLATNSMVAYAITRNRKKNKLFKVSYYYLISALFIPFQVIMLPLVQNTNMLGLNNVLGITLLYIVFGLPMNTFLYCGYIRSLPESIDEAATIDGANPIQTFFRVIFPMMKPIHSTVAILTIMWTWNDFLMPLLLLSEPDSQTLQLSQYVFHGQFSSDYNLAFASYIMVIMPMIIMYIICQRWIISGVTRGSIKA